jgi:uncharacterized protein (DUF2141 family)
VYLTPTCSPTITNTAVANINGTITMPGVTTEDFAVILFDASKSFASAQILAGSFTASATASYNGYVPAGDYYVLAVVYTSGGPFGPPAINDHIGISGYAWPAWPSSPNITVPPAGSGSVTADITTALISAANVSGTITMPATADGKVYNVILDSTSGTGGGDAASQSGTISTGTNTFTYSFYAWMPGAYWLYSLVDVSGDGDGNNTDFNVLEPVDYFGYYAAARRAGRAKRGNNRRWRK